MDGDDGDNRLDLVALLLWVVWQYYATAVTLDQWAKIKDNQYNSLKEDLEEIKRKVG